MGDGSRSPAIRCQQVTQVRFYRAAADEAEAAVRWYNERVPGLGDDFRLELVAGIERIREQPYTWTTGISVSVEVRVA